MSSVSIHKQPATCEELNTQPLINSHVIGAKGCHLGERKKNNYVSSYSRPTLSINSWCATCLLNVNFIASHFNIHRGVRAHDFEIGDVVPHVCLHIIQGDSTLSRHTRRWAVFSKQRTPLLVRFRDMVISIAEKHNTSWHVRLLVPLLGILDLLVSLGSP